MEKLSSIVVFVVKRLFEGVNDEKSIKGVAKTNVVSKIANTI